MNRYDKGDKVRLTAAFANSAGSAIDPSTVAVLYKAPGAGTVTKTYGSDAELVKDSTGNYHIDLDADTPGTWRWRWQSTGTGKAAAEGSFVVEQSSFD